MYELDFLCPNGNLIKFEIKVDNYNDENLQKIMRPLLFENYLSILLKIYSYDDLLIFYNDAKEVPREELERIVWKQDSPKYKCIEIKKKCLGCQNNIANQLGHMNVDGCLYKE